MAVQPSTLPQCLPEMVERIVRRFDPLRILLFATLTIIGWRLARQSAAGEPAHGKA